MNNKKTEESNKGYTPNINITRYKDRDGISIKKLEQSLWLAHNKKYFVKGFYTVLFIISILTWSFFVVIFGSYLGEGMQEDVRLTDSIVTNKALVDDYKSRTMPEDIKISAVETIKDAAGDFYFISRVKNINNRYWAEISYTFIQGGEEFGPIKDFILPETETVLTSLSLRKFPSSSSVKLKVNNVKWNRLDRHEVPEWSSYKKEYLSYQITNKKFTPHNLSELSENERLSKVSFTILNESPHSYLDAPLDIILFNQGKIVSYTNYSIDKYEAGGKYDIEIVLADPIIRVDNIIISPRINIFAN